MTCLKREQASDLESLIAKTPRVLSAITLAARAERSYTKSPPSFLRPQMVTSSYRKSVEEQSIARLHPNRYEPE